MSSFQFLEAILSLPDIYDEYLPRVSPDGRWVAWTWSRINPAADVYTAPTDGSSPPIRLTATTENTWFSYWLPDSSGVLVEQDKDGNERVQVFRVDLEQPLKMIPLTEPDPNYYISSPRLHPNRHWLVYGANVEATTDKEIEQTWIYRHDLLSGERIPLAKPLKAGSAMPEMSPKGSHILYSRNDLHPAGRQVWLVDIEGKDDHELLNVGADKKVYAHWLPDGQGAVVLAETDTHKRVGVWELNSDEIRWLVDDPDRDIEDAFAPYRSNIIVIVENMRASTTCSLIALDTGIETRIPDIDGNLIPLAPHNADEWVGYYYSSQHPTDLVRFSISDPRLEGFSSLTRIWKHTKLTPVDFAQAQDFRWRSMDGLEIHGWLYQPKGSAKGSILYIHGGPTWHSQSWINAQIQFFVHNGFNVLDVNYRGSTGYGLAFCNAIREDGWGGKEQEDIRTAAEALIAAGIAEPGKVGITGTSYGGYSSWFAITNFPPQVIAAAAPICGMTDLVVDYETTRPDIRPYSEEMMGGSPAQVPEIYHARSPVNFIKDIRGQLLIIQGGQDPNVTPENLRVVETALAQAGIPYQKLIFEDEGHGISKVANLSILYRRLLEFFEGAFTGEVLG